MSEEQELWERIFIAALTGTATNADQWPEKRDEFIVNRAYHIADKATPMVLARRKVDAKTQG